MSVPCLEHAILRSWAETVVRERREFRRARLAFERRATRDLYDIVAALGPDGQRWAIQAWAEREHR